METETEPESGLEQHQLAIQESHKADDKMKLSAHSVVHEMMRSRRTQSHHRKRSTLSTFLCCGRNFDSEDESADESSSNPNVDRREEKRAGMSAVESSASQGPSKGADQRPSLQKTHSKGSSKEVPSIPSFTRSHRVPSRVSEERSKSHADVPIEKREVQERLASSADKSTDSSGEDEKGEERDSSEEDISSELSARNKIIPVQGTGDQHVSWALHHGRKRSQSWDKNRYTAKRRAEAKKKALSGSMKFLKHLNNMMKAYPKGSDSAWLSNTSISTSPITSTTGENSESDYSRSRSRSRIRSSESESERSSERSSKSRSSTSSRPRKLRRKIRGKKRGKCERKPKRKRRARYKSTSSFTRSRGQRVKKRVKKKPRRRRARRTHRSSGKRSRYAERSPERSRNRDSKASSNSRVRSQHSHQYALDNRSDCLPGSVRGSPWYHESCFIPHSGMYEYRHGGRRCHSTVRRRPDRPLDERYRYVIATTGRSRARTSSCMSDKAGGHRGEERPSWDNRF